MRIARRPQHRRDIPLVLALHAAADAGEHRRLDVLGVDAAVGTDALGELQREPAAGGAELGDLRTFGDAERVHDLIRFLPLLTIGSLEQAQVLRAEEARIRFRLWRGRGWMGRRGGIGRTGQHDDPYADDRRQRRFHRVSSLPALPPFLSFPAVPVPPSPTTPPLVMDSTDRISFRRLSSSRPRSSTSARMDLPLLTDSLASSAVAA